MRVVTILLVLAILAGAALFGGYRYWESRLEAPIAVDQATLYEVPRGAGYNRVVADLAAKGIIRDDWAFRLLTRVEPESIPQLRAGEYMLEPGMSGRDLIDLLGSDRVVTYPLTIPEGWTFRQMRAALETAPKLESRTAGLEDDEVMALLGREGEHPEAGSSPTPIAITRA